MLKSLLQTGRTSILQPLIKTDIYLAQQTRNTFILKRRWEPRLSKKGAPAQRLRGRNFVYDFVDDTNTIKKPEIQVILTDYVTGIGYRGDLVSMKPLRAYNKLLITGMAVYDTPENRAKYDTEARLKEIRRSPFMERTINEFADRLVCVKMNKFKPWTIEPRHIRASMRQHDLHVLNDSQIELPKTPITGPDLAKQNMDFYVTVTINNSEKARVRCRIHHFTTDVRKQEIYSEDPSTESDGLLFPDDESQQLFQNTHPSPANSTKSM